MFSEDTSDNNQQQSNTSDPSTSNTNPFVDKLKHIVNEKGEPKYKSVEDALEALDHSQKFIETLKSEKSETTKRLEEIQAELEKRKSVEDAVAELMGKQREPNHTDDGKTNQKTVESLDEERVRKLIEETFQGKTRQEREAQNLNTVVNSLKEAYGDKAKDIIKEKAKELNTTPTELEKLARNNPKMAMSLLGGAVVSPSSNPSPQTQNTPHTPPKKETPPPKKGLINGGATSEDLKTEWQLIKEDVYKKYDVQT